MAGGPVYAEIPLKEELVASFCRRGRRRLREIQVACGVELRLDRQRRLLLASADSPTAVAALRKHLAGLAGERRPVPPAVWAELMRTRTSTEGEEATIARIQEKCGCRVHIERSRAEVRLFGEDDSVRVADMLLSEFEQGVTEQALTISRLGELSPMALQQLAHKCGVTLRVELEQLVVLGLKGRVAGALEEIEKYIQDPFEYDLYDGEAGGSPDGRVASEDDFSSGGASSYGGCAPWPTTNIAEPVCRPAPQVGTKMAPPQHSTQQQTGQQQVSPAVCPTCGCGRFCAHCGKPVWTVMPMDLATYAASVPHGQLPFVNISRGQLPPMVAVAGACDTGSPGSTRSGATPEPGTPEEMAPHGWPSGFHIPAMMPQGAMPAMCLVPAAVLQGYDGGGGAGTAPTMQSCMISPGAAGSYTMSPAGFVPVPTQGQVPSTSLADR